MTILNENEEGNQYSTIFLGQQLFLDLEFAYLINGAGESEICCSISNGYLLMYLDLESGIVRTQMNLKLFGAIWNLRVEIGLEIRLTSCFLV